MPPIRRAIQAVSGPLSRLSRLIDEIHPSRTASENFDPLSEAEAASLDNLLPGKDLFHRTRDSNLTIPPLTIDEMLALGTPSTSTNDQIWDLLGVINDAAYRKASEDQVQTGIPLDAAMKLLRQGEDFDQLFGRAPEGPAPYISNLKQALKLSDYLDIVEGPLAEPARQAKAYLSGRRR